MALALLNALGIAQSTEGNIQMTWRTYAERTDYRETPRYAETLAYCRRLAQSSPLIRVASFGTSGEARELLLVIAAKDAAFTSEAARSKNRIVVLIQACIHAGESDGKDAGLALLRDIAITKTETALLDNVVVLFIPIYNVDGHERFSPFNRMNQNGPDAMGWRANATNLNLNRDYMKADAPETRAWLKLWNQWTPDLFIDCHTTDGADFQYNLTYQLDTHAGIAAPVREWTTDAFRNRIFPAVERHGNLLAPYVQLRDNRQPAQGMDAFIATPRFATGYVPLRNRPALLIETHSLKSYRSRVRGTYDLLRETLIEINREPDKLKRAVRAADDAMLKSIGVYDRTRTLPLGFDLSDKSRPFNFKGIAARTELSEISGALRVIYDGKPAQFEIPFYDDVIPVKTIAPPVYYVVPAAWRDALDVLRAHGVELKKLATDATLDVEGYRIDDLKFSPASFENRVPVSFKTTAVSMKKTVVAGSYIVPVKQQTANVVIQLLEPNAPDSLMTWGFFNSAFEQKEYGESYVLEKLAREMLSRDPALRREFEERIRTDRAFAASSATRLRFFHERSPYWDERLNVYPILRVTTSIDERTLLKP
ncbi:MAG: M14 family metallopeptidase [Pyrinomonadaceae bacterium MAG19_C2-C3]|nr:M14 family metallopeptidase [Pyrinomonadaceae bacterium MAG19_C2-C3]